MSERGAALVESLVALAVTAAVWAAATSALSALPALAARWEDHSALRQRARVVDSRAGRALAGAGPIDVTVDGRALRVPAVWPRRLGLVRPDAARVVSSSSVTIVSRTDMHRVLILDGALAGSPADVNATAAPPCGSAPWCGVGEGDMVLAVDRTGACALYRVTSLGVRMRLEALMPGPERFEPGSVVVPVAVVVFEFDAQEQAIRKYDGYRSDNVLVDAVRAVAIDAGLAPGALLDGPFLGAGAMAYDADQLAIRRIAMRVEMADAAAAASRRVDRFEWALGWR
ncbi:MAG: hypothetical protein M3R55_12340 [Acidobacteriota bacterium]|nr:hypothetical protein [Acidobacteriota bacterium]